MLTKKNLAEGLHRDARYLSDWLVGALEIYENRNKEDIVTAAQSYIQSYCADGSPFSEDDLICLWEWFEDSALLDWRNASSLIEMRDEMKKGLALPSIDPEWEIPEIALVVGAILAEKAAEYFKSPSHKKHLLAASMLNDAQTAKHYWANFRGIGQSRNTDHPYVKAINKAENKLEHMKLLSNIDGASNYVSGEISEALKNLSQDAETGRAFKQGRKTNTGSPIRKKIANLLRKNSEITNFDLLEKVRLHPPKGYSFYDTTHSGRYFEKPGHPSMGVRRFFNICGEERGKVRAKITG